MEELSVDQDFLMRFSCMGTQDKDVLISQLHGLLDSQISREGCAFFLDMTNWNLQAAVGAFYDHYSAEGGMLPDVALVMRIREGGGKRMDSPMPIAPNPIAPNTTITETWTLRNTGSVVWPLGVHLIVKGVSDLCTLQHLPLPSLSPGQDTTITMEVKAPPSPGVYQCHWRAALPGGALFGDPMWLTVHVQEDELVSGLVQQLSAFSTGDGRLGAMELGQRSTEELRNRHSAAPNPFGTPIGTEDPSFSSGSMMSSPHTVPSFSSGSMMSSPQTVPSTIEQLLLPTCTSSTLQFSPRPLLQSTSPNHPSSSLQNISESQVHSDELNTASRLDPSSTLNPGSDSPIHTDTQTRTSSAATAMEDSADHS